MDATDHFRAGASEACAQGFEIADADFNFDFAVRFRRLVHAESIRLQLMRRRADGGRGSGAKWALVEVKRVLWSDLDLSGAWWSCQDAWRPA